MAKKIKLNLEEYDALKDATIFDELPLKIRRKVLKKRKNLNPNSVIIESLKEHQIYIVDNSHDFLQIFGIEAIEFSEKKVFLRMIELTPTYNDNSEKYPIYRVGIPLDNQGTLYISGEERQKLADKQLQKWDYFFQVSIEELVHQHLYMIDIFERLKERCYKEMKSKALLFGVPMIIVIAFAFYIHSTFGTLISLIVFYLLLNNSFYFYKEINLLKSFITRLITEKEFLEDQVIQTKVSSTQMEKWLEEELSLLDDEIIIDLELPKELIKRLKWKDIGNDIVYDKSKVTGLMIQEWGYFQPLSTEGKKTLSREHWHHLHALRMHGKRHLVGIYYITFIYLTEDAFGVSSFFYNYILSRRFGQTTKKYYHRDIVSIGTVIKESKVFSDKAELETKQVIISFYNDEQIIITLTDKVTIENLREKLDKKIIFKEDDEIAQDDDSVLIPTNLSELGRLLSVDDNLPGTRVNAIVKTLKQFWNEKKKFTLPSSREIVWYLDKE